MATGGGDEESELVDQDQEESQERIPDDDDKDQGVGRRKRNPAGILRIDTTAANQPTSRRKSSSGSVDYRFTSTLNPQVGYYPFGLFIVVIL